MTQSIRGVKRCKAFISDAYTKRQRHLNVSLLFLDSSVDEPRLKYIYSMSPSGKNSLGIQNGRRL